MVVPPVMNDRLSNIMLLVVQLILPSNDWSCHISQNLTVTEHAPTYDLGRLVARSAPTCARPNVKFCYRKIIRTTSRAIAACDRNSVFHQTFTIDCVYFKSTEIARPKKSYDPVWLKPYTEWSFECNAHVHSLVVRHDVPKHWWFITGETANINYMRK